MIRRIGNLIVSPLAFLLLFCGLALAQEAPQPPEPPAAPNPNAIPAPAPPVAPRPPMAGRERMPGRPGGMIFHGPPMGKWWNDSELVKELGVSDAQVQQIEQIFQNHRLQLIDLRADVEKQEAILDPLVEADRPDESKVIGQIDKVAAARANLEKSNARMLLAIRRVLTVDQWKKLEAQSRDHEFRRQPRTPRLRHAPAAPPSR